MAINSVPIDAFRISADNLTHILYPSEGFVDSVNFHNLQRSDWVSLKKVKIRKQATQGSPL